MHESKQKSIVFQPKAIETGVSIKIKNQARNNHLRNNFGFEIHTLSRVEPDDVTTLLQIWLIFTRMLLF